MKIDKWESLNEEKKGLQLDIIIKNYSNFIESNVAWRRFWLFRCSKQSFISSKFYFINEKNI